MLYVQFPFSFAGCIIRSLIKKVKENAVLAELMQALSQLKPTQGYLPVELGFNMDGNVHIVHVASAPVLNAYDVARTAILKAPPVPLPVPPSLKRSNKISFLLSRLGVTVRNRCH